MGEPEGTKGARQTVLGCAMVVAGLIIIVVLIALLSSGGGRDGRPAVCRDPAGYRLYLQDQFDTTREDAEALVRKLREEEGC